MCSTCSNSNNQTSNHSLDHYSLDHYSLDNNPSDGGLRQAWGGSMYEEAPDMVVDQSILDLPDNIPVDEDSTVIPGTQIIPGRVTRLPCPRSLKGDVTYRSTEGRSLRSEGEYMNGLKKLPLNVMKNYKPPTIAPDPLEKGLSHGGYRRRSGVYAPVSGPTLDSYTYQSSLQHNADSVLPIAFDHSQRMFYQDSRRDTVEPSHSIPIQTMEDTLPFARIPRPAIFHHVNAYVPFQVSDPKAPSEKFTIDPIDVSVMTSFQSPTDILTVEHIDYDLKEKEHISAANAGIVFLDDLPQDSESLFTNKVKCAPYTDVSVIAQSDPGYKSSQAKYDDGGKYIERSDISVTSGSVSINVSSDHPPVDERFFEEVTYQSATSGNRVPMPSTRIDTVPDEGSFADKQNVSAWGGHAGVPSDRIDTVPDERLFVDEQCVSHVPAWGGNTGVPSTRIDTVPDEKMFVDRKDVATWGGLVPALAVRIDTIPDEKLFIDRKDVAAWGGYSMSVLPHDSATSNVNMRLIDVNEIAASAGLSSFECANDDNNVDTQYALKSIDRPDISAVSRGVNVQVSDSYKNLTGITTLDRLNISVLPRADVIVRHFHDTYQSTDWCGRDPHKPSISAAAGDASVWIDDKPHPTPEGICKVRPVLERMQHESNNSGPLPMMLSRNNLFPTETYAGGRSVF